MTDTEGLPPALEGADASVRFVHHVLTEADGWLTYAALKGRTGYSQPTISTAVKRLSRRDLVEQRRAPDDPRRCQVRVTDDSADGRREVS